MKPILLTLALLTAAAPALAQTSVTPPFPVTLEKELAARASSFTEVTMDKKMLGFASSFMHDDHDAQVRAMIQNLDGIFVRAYEFDKAGQYSTADLDHVRSQFQGAEWVPMVKVREHQKGSDNEDTDVYFKTVNGQMRGMFVLNAEPKELNLVYIAGPINPDELGKLVATSAFRRRLRSARPK